MELVVMTWRLMVLMKLVVLRHDTMLDGIDGVGCHMTCHRTTNSINTINLHVMTLDGIDTVGCPMTWHELWATLPCSLMVLMECWLSCDMTWCGTRKGLHMTKSAEMVFTYDRSVKMVFTYVFTYDKCWNGIYLWQELSLIHISEPTRPP